METYIRVTYLSVTVDLSLDLLGDNKFGYFCLNLHDAELKGLRDFFHVNYFVRRYVLDQGLLSDFLHHN